MSFNVYKSAVYQDESGGFGESETRVLYCVDHLGTDTTTFIERQAHGVLRTVLRCSDALACALANCDTVVVGPEAQEVMAHYQTYDQESSGVAAAGPTAGPVYPGPRAGAVSPAKTPEDAAAVPNAEEWEKPVLGYFDFLGDRYMLTRIDGGMLVGYNIKNGGGVDTLHIHRDSVRALVMINNN